VPDHDDNNAHLDHPGPGSGSGAARWWVVVVAAAARWWVVVAAAR